MSRQSLLLLCLFTLLPARFAAGNSVAPVSLDERLDQAVAICRATVLGGRSFRGDDGRLYTRTALRVDEVLKGRFAETVTLVHRGGVLAGTGETYSDSPEFQPGEERLLLLGRRADATLFANDGPAGAMLLRAAGDRATTGGNPWHAAMLNRIRNRYPEPAAAGADVRSAAGGLESAAVTGLSTSGGVSRRFLRGDRGEPIEYLVDMDALPAGITTNQAMSAVSNAFNAWEATTSLRFQFAGVTSFGQAPAGIETNDARIRVQLHDQHGQITGGTTLGQGGNGFSISPAFPNGGLGGNVNGNEFFPVVRGYLTLKHTSVTMQNLETFEEVLAHEIGHVLSMAHSSESQFESDTNLNQAIMYFQAHADGRGARLESYDRATVQQIYPTNNTPPFTVDRVLDTVTHSSGANPQVTGINELEIRGYDLQGTNNLSLSLATTSGSGTFSLAGPTLRYNPGGFIGAPRIDPADGSFYARAFVRVSDGTNASPFAVVRVLSFQPDRFPGGASDGLPDDWMTGFFGSADPAAGANRGPGDDFDGDGVSNLDEFRSGTDPTRADSVLKFTGGAQGRVEFNAQPFDAYEIQGTTDFTNWSRVANPAVPETTNAVVTNFFGLAGDRHFFRVLRVP